MSCSPSSPGLAVALTESSRLCLQVEMYCAHCQKVQGKTFQLWMVSGLVFDTFPNDLYFLSTYTSTGVKLRLAMKGL